MPEASIYWLLLLHQLPTRQDALRVRVWRRLQAVGAVSVRNACWCLPDTAAAREDFQWCVQEIAAAGGEAMVCRSALVEGMSNDQIRGLFRAARDADYAALVAEVRTVADAVSPEDREALARQAARLRRSFAAIVAIDHGAAPGRAAAEQALVRLERLAARRTAPPDPHEGLPTRAACRDRTWVTRADIGIDRAASAWFIRRFIDAKAAFRFVADDTAPHRRGELRFDMFDAEFTHRGDRCTFEVLLGWSGRDDPALAALGGIIHDLDLKDGRYQRPETAGVACALAGIVASVAADAQRVERACALFDAIHAGLAARLTGGQPS